MRKARKGVLIALIIILGAALLVVALRWLSDLMGLESADRLSTYITGFETAGLFVSLVLAIRQLSDSKEISRATFIMELNRAYVENADYRRMYNALQESYDRKCGCENGCAECAPTFTKGEVSNYLTFFETVYILYKDGAISLEIINELFAYRFFLAVHNELVQEMKLKPQPDNFKNIFCLEYEWLKYRRAHGEAADDAPDTVYGQNLLRELVSAKDYKRLITDD